MHKLPPGKYYIGDPCYVFSRADWSDLLDETDSFDQDDIQKFKDHELWAFSTKWGDGGYMDQNGVEYSVDSGLLGVVPVELASNPEGLEHGTVMDFPKGIVVEHENGTFWMGPICIKTDDAGEYQEEEEEFGSDEIDFD